MGYITGLRKVHEFDLGLFLAYVACVWVFKLEVYPLPKDFNVGLRENLIIFWMGIISIFVNVIPKYFKKTGANRHFNDQTQKKFLSRNYIRLFIHILSGGFSFLFSGYTLWNYHYGLQSYSLVTIKCICIFLDFLHETTIIVMMRNHDGIILLRVNNTSAAVMKAYYCMKLWHSSSLDEAIPFISAIFVFTCGFMTTRVYSASIAITQLAFGLSLKTMAENWYSCGTLLSQLHIISRTGTVPLVNALFPFFCYHFRHELWTKKNGLRNQTFMVGLIPVAIFVATKMQLDELLLNNLYHVQIHILLGVYCFFFAGPYFKRQPVLGVDFGVEKKEEKTETADLASKTLERSDSVAPKKTRFAAATEPKLSPIAPEASELNREMAAGWGRMSYYPSWASVSLDSIKPTNSEEEEERELLDALEHLPSIASVAGTPIVCAETPKFGGFWNKRVVSFRRTIR